MPSSNPVATNPSHAQARSFVGCTVVYRDELPNAAVLTNSFRRFYPEAAFVILVIDGVADQTTRVNAEILPFSDLGFDAGEPWRLPMLLKRRELRTYLEAVLLEHLSRTRHRPVAYFSAFTQIFADLPDLIEMMGTTDVIVATELISNEWGDGGRSFIGVPVGSSAILGTCLERIRDSIKASEGALEGLFEVVPHRLVQQRGFGVNYSNLNPASLSQIDRRFEIEGGPLRSFDFRGYDPDKPHLLSRYAGVEPRILLSEFPVVAELCDAYRQQLVDAGHAPGSSARRRFNFLPSGLPIDARMLRVYRDALARFRSGESSEPPSPFGPGGEEGFVKWLNEPIDRAGKGVTRYMLAVYEDRPDVKAAFPDPTGSDAAAFRHWYLAYGSKELGLPAALVPPRKPMSTTGAAPVSIAGYFRAELGLGTAARSLVAALEAAAIPIHTLTFDGTANRLAHPFTERSAAGWGADTNIVCVNPDQIALFAERAGPEFWRGRYSIGVWFWEVEDFPASCHHAFNHVDEVWVASEFMRQTFLKVSPKPVFKFRLPVLAPTIDNSLTRSQLNLPEQFIFLFSFDFLSVLARKNPLGLIEAFSAAFAPGEGPRLVIKTINGDRRPIEMEKLKYAARGRPDIVLMDGYLDAIKNATLTSLCDCYVSLHRSEGFGLTIAEAMALGKPAIATAYSGNLEFMTPENSYLCPARRSEVGPEREPYPADSYWSEPDLAVAADLLRKVYSQPEQAQARGRRAAEDIRSFHSPAVVAKMVADRLGVIRRRREAPGPARSAEFFQDQIDELEKRIR